MVLITAMVEDIKKLNQREWYIFLCTQKYLVEKHFKWLNLQINLKTKSLVGRGVLYIDGKSRKILISYSPFHNYRYDRIFIIDNSIRYHRDIHLYHDSSLCLYHPAIDQSLFQKIPLFQMIPWIGEWIVFYEQWKKYGVWLGEEIKH